MTDSLKTELKIGWDSHAVLNYISIVNRKISWPVLVLTIPFVANVKFLSAVKRCLINENVFPMKRRMSVVYCREAPFV